MTKNKESHAAIQAYLTHESPHVQNRATIILETLDGKSAEEIATLTNLSERTIKKWQGAWDEDGMAIFPEETPSSQAEETEPVATQATDVHELEFSENPPIMSSDSLADAGGKIMLAQFQSMIEHDAFVRVSADVEAVHQMRVATRRWRSIHVGVGDYLSKSYRKSLTKNIRRTARKLGAVRDLDILLEKTHLFMDENPDVDNDSLQALAKLISKDRRKEQKKLQKWLNSKKYMRFVQRAFKRLNQTDSGKQPVRVDYVLPKLIYERLETIRTYDSVIETAEVEVLHRLRVECKRLRYMLEGFTPVLGDEILPVVEILKILQDHLGDMNDTKNAVETIRVYEKSMKKSQRSAIKAFRNYQKAKLEELRSTFPDVWSQFNNQENRQILAQAIGTL